MSINLRRLDLIILSLLLIAGLSVFARAAHAHPVAQGAGSITISLERVDIQLRVSLEEVLTEQMLSPEHIGPNFYITEDTYQEDGYEASLDVLGGHASAQIEPTEALRIIGGVRFEHSKQAMKNVAVRAVARLAPSLART